MRNHVHEVKPSPVLDPDRIAIATPLGLLSTHPGTTGARAMALAFCCIGAGCASAWAWEAKDLLAFGTAAFVVHPNVTVAEQYNDNIFYLDKNKIGDEISIIRPGVEILAGRPEHPLSGDFRYTLGEMLYAENSAQNSMDHELSADVNYKGNKVQFLNHGEFQELSSIYGGYNSFQLGGTGGGGKLDRTMYKLGHTFSYDISQRTDTYVKADIDSSDFSTGVPLRDVASWRATAGFTLKPTTKLGVFSELYFGTTTPGSNLPGVAAGADLDTVGGFVGVRVDLANKVSGSVKLGYEEHSFSDHSNAPGSPVVEVRTTYHYSTKTQFSVQYTRKGVLPVQYTSRFATKDDASLNLRHTFGVQRRLSAGLTGSYGRNDFLAAGVNPARMDAYYSFGGDLTYQFKLWLSGSLSYEFDKLAGNDPNTIDYQVNRITLALVVGY